MADKVKRLDRATVNKLVIRLAMGLDGIPYHELTELETRLFQQMKAADILRLSDSEPGDEEVEYSIKADTWTSLRTRLKKKHLLKS